MNLNQLANHQNLKLAWRRITTGINNQYKLYYRNLYMAYEVALDNNLRDLRQRLLGGAFLASHPERIYVPKASGLHRPLSLLNLEDQIVLQAFANLAARKMQTRRAPLQSKVIFSNILEKPDSIFFFRPWQDSYRTYQKHILEKYSGGMRWVGDFDLAAFFDTISHELLLKTIYPKASNASIDLIKDCLKTWSSGQADSGHGHGLPQGPLASAFLSECFLLPIDLALMKNPGYMRYVDDVRFFGAKEDDVRAGLIELERHCRERGLIPQTGKFAIRRAENVHEALGVLPSISDARQIAGTEKIDKKKAWRGLRSSIGGKPIRINDKTRFRYIIFRAEPDNQILNLVLRLVPRHPEHADAFFAYLSQFEYRKPIERLCQDLVTHNPYPYLRGEAWHVLSRYHQEDRSMVSQSPGSLTSMAVEIAKLKNQEGFIERWGACHFLCVSEKLTTSKHNRLLKFQTPLLQSLLTPVMPDAAFNPGKVIEVMLKQAAVEPGLSACSALHQRGIKIGVYGLKTNQLASQIVNTLRRLGVISTPGLKVDPIGEILNVRYAVPRGKSWHKLLGKEYVHALGLLNQAEAAFYSGRSFWLACQNSFNQTVFLALQRHLHAIGHAAACTTTNRKGQLEDFGVTLESAGPFSRNCPNIGDCFRDMNTRRNHLPVSHPYDKKTSSQSSYLKAQERNKFVAKLRIAYTDLLSLMP